MTSKQNENVFKLKSMGDGSNTLFTLSERRNKEYNKY